MGLTGWGRFLSNKPAMSCVERSLSAASPNASWAIALLELSVRRIDLISVSLARSHRRRRPRPVALTSYA